MKFCESCGNALQPEDQFCGKCGAPVKKKSTKSGKEGKKNKRIVILACILTATILVAIFGVFAVPAIKTYQTYQKAEKLLQDKKYEQAKKIYHKLGDYKNSENQKKACDYGIAEEYLEENDYEKAKTIYEELAGYNDSDEKIKLCEYQVAEEYKDNKSYQQAVEIYETLGNYKEAEQHLLDCKYEIANGYFVDGSYQDAYELYAELEKVKYPGAKEKSQDALQEAAEEKYEEKIDELEIKMEEYRETYEEEEGEVCDEQMFWDFCDITGDGIDELFVNNPTLDYEACIEVYTYKAGKVSLIGTMGNNYSYYYSKEGNIILADYGSCGCENKTLYQCQDGKLEQIAAIFSDDYEDYRKEDLPKGRFKKTDWVYCYTEEGEETQYYTDVEFKSVFQKKYGVGWDEVGWNGKKAQELNITYWSRYY